MRQSLNFRFESSTLWLRHNFDCRKGINPFQTSSGVWKVSRNGYHSKLFHWSHTYSWNNPPWWTFQTDCSSRIFPWRDWKITDCCLVRFFKINRSHVDKNSDTHRKTLLKLFFSEDIWIKHERKLCTGDNAEYWSKRNPKGKDKKLLQKTINKFWYQRNYLDCAIDVK